MARGNTRKVRPPSASTPSQAEAVEQLRDAVGRLIARRVLREWVQSQGARDTVPPPPADAKGPR